MIFGHASAALDPARLAAKIGMKADPWQLAVLRKPHQRELLVVHRQGGKSATAAVAAVHQGIFVPSSLILVVSPSQRQSQELFRSVLTLYRSLGRPVPAETENALSITLENGSRVVALPADASTIRGYSNVRLLIIDEAAFVSDDTLAAVRPMLAVSEGRMLAMSTPFGRRGWFYEASRSSEWRVTTVRASECPRISPAFLEAERAALGDWRFRQEYECEFIDQAGRMFATDDLEAMFAAQLDERALFTPSPAAVVAPQAAAPAAPKGWCVHHRYAPWDAGRCISCGATAPLEETA